MRILFALAGAAFLSPWALFSQPIESYREAPDAVRAVFAKDKFVTRLDVPSADRQRFLIRHTTELSTLQKMSRDTLRLAMLEIRPSVFREWRHDTFGVDRLEVFTLMDQNRRRVRAGAGLISDAQFSPDGEWVAFVLHEPEGSFVWTASTQTGEAARLSDARVMATLAGRTAFRTGARDPSRLLSWTPEGTIMTLLVPEGLGSPPEAGLPEGPVIRSTGEEALPTPTYPFLLNDAHDEALFRYYTTAQLAEIGPDGTVRPLGAPAMYLGFHPSPDGEYVLTDEIVEPLSRRVSLSLFAERQSVVARSGETLGTIRELELVDGGDRSRARRERDHPREVAWRPDVAELAFFWRTPNDTSEGLEDEDESPTEPDSPDRLMTLGAPFDPTAASLIANVEGRFMDVVFSREAEALVTLRDGYEEKAKERIVVVSAGSGETSRIGTTSLAGPYDPEDVVEHPGRIFVDRLANGTPFALRSDDGSFYLHGEGYSRDLRHRPSVDRVGAAGSKSRVFRGSRDVYEEPLVALDDEFSEFIVNREAKTEFPDSYLFRESRAPLNLTNNVDPFPAITSAERLDFDFTRRDGVQIRARISLPVDYEPGSRVPAIFWTYPREYGSMEDYDRASLMARSRNRYHPMTYLRWSDIWLTQGYAVVHPDVPIIKEGTSYNDNYVQHLVDSLYAAVRKVDELGMVDVDRIGHGGHSYGAFATANLLSRTPFFKAGIAGNGAYNRTLTPLGFQSERRYLWQAPSVYLEMSPFFQADHLDTPLLMYHGMDDNNTGTFPIQSERYLQALTGLGKTAVLYLYPYESHSPRAKKTYLDLWARWLDWFDEYVKQETDPETATNPASGRMP